MRKHIFLTLFCCFLLSSCARNEYVAIRGYAQGGVYTVKCKPGRCGSETLKNGIDSIIGIVDRAVSGYNPGSLLSRINNGGIMYDSDADSIIVACGPLPGGCTAEKDVLRRLIAFGDSVRMLTGGAVDTRAAALFDVWGFGFKEGRLPSEEEVAEAIKDRSKLNFNAVAQGFTSDEVAKYLRGRGIEDMLVDIGGEMYCSGLNPSGKGWTLGIDAPVDGNNSPGANMALTFTLPEGSCCGVVTSGNYRKYYIVDGIKYTHSIDPRTGRPVQHNLLSATVIAPTSALADALATYAMVVGVEEFVAAVGKMPDGMSVDFCLITCDGILTSEKFPKNR